MLRRLIIHAGMPRAGSSTLQEVLFHHHGKLEAQGLLYPVLGAEHAIAGELTQIYNHKLLFQSARGLWPTKAFRPLHDEIASKINSSPAGTVLLSYEGWWDPRNHRRLKRTLKALGQTCNGLTPEIACVVREPVAFIVSLYKLDVLHGRTMENFDAYWPAKLSDRRLRYTTIADSFAAITPTPRFIDFDAASQDGQLVGSMLATLGLGQVLNAAGLSQLAQHRSGGGAVFSDAVVSMVLFAARARGLRFALHHRKRLLPALLKLAHSSEHGEACATLAIPVSAASVQAIMSATAAQAGPLFNRHFGHMPATRHATSDRVQSEILQDSSLARAILAELAVLTD
jgi:hypothetical protein